MSSKFLNFIFFCNLILWCRLLETVPLEERPPILISIYADGIDRDEMARSSGRNKLHCSYMRIINLCNSGLRSRYDYDLIMILHEATIAKYGYDACHERLIAQITKLVNFGVLIDGKRHAVRIAYLQV